MFFVQHRKIFYSIIGALSVIAIGALLIWRVVFGIEFTGGTMIEIAYEGERPAKELLESRVAELAFGNSSLRRSGDDGYFLRLRDISEEEYQKVREALSPQGAELVEKRRSTVGPTIGEELKNKALVAIVIVVLLIILYVAFAFRNVRIADDDESQAKKKLYTPDISSWNYGFISILVLLHDILIPLGVFAFLGKFAGAEVDVLIVMALLTILGYSVNDTIVIFDRVRENLLKNRDERVEEAFALTVGTSLSQTYARSINTSLTTLMVVLSLLIFGGSTTMYFALTLAAGVFAGTYSSLALAAPLLVTLEERKRLKAGREAPPIPEREPEPTDTQESPEVPAHGEVNLPPQEVQPSIKPPQQKKKKKKNKKKKRR
jgi:preprotein translocase subunit SecF